MRLIVFRFWFPLFYFLIAIGLCVYNYFANHRPDQGPDKICIGSVVWAFVYFSCLKAWNDATRSTTRVFGFYVVTMLAAMIVSLFVALLFAVGRIAHLI